MMAVTVLTYPNLIFGTFFSILSLWILNGQSEDIKQKMRKRKQGISDLVISDNIVEINGKFHPESYARTHLINIMTEFQGFDVYGFATLGKPFLSSIFATFMTYLIILIQFKISVIDQ